MRTLWPNLDRQDGLETVLEVPIPEEMFASSNNSNKNRSWQNMKSWVKPSTDKSPPPSIFGGNRIAEIQLLLGVVGAPLIPLPISSAHSLSGNVKDHAIEASTAKYIVQQYIAATGGEKALNSIDSMYAMGKVKMAASEFIAGRVGGFVLWQKRPELWCLELVVSGFKISAGSDAGFMFATINHDNGLDPRSTANLFSNSICIGEKTIDKEDCFVLKLEAESSTLKARSSSNVDIIRHTIWGYFSQRTGLLTQLEDSHLLRIKALGDSESVFWETTMESHIQDYKTVDGINIAHAGRTAVSLFRYGESTESHSRTQMEEVWKIEEVDFNIVGLSMDCFLAPGDLKKTEEKEDQEEGCGVVRGNVVLPFKVREGLSRPVGVSKVADFDLDDLENSKYDEE
ncbi:hypothetical protein C3L33_02845, partial [Rhododendron williamsianum]